MFVEVQKVVMETPEDSQVHAEASPTAGVIRTDTLTLTSSSCLASDSTHVWRGGQFDESKASMNPGQDSTPNPVSPQSDRRMAKEMRFETAFERIE